MSQPETPDPLQTLAEKLEARIAAGIRLDVPTRDIAQSCVDEVAAALRQAQALQREADAQIVETVDLNANGAVLGTDEIIMRIAEAIRREGSKAPTPGTPDRET